MKKWITAILSLTLSSSAVASPKPFTGFYSGVNLGLIQSKVNNDYNRALISPTFFHQVLSSDLKLTDTAIMGGLTLGYSDIVNGMFVLGIEGRANFQNLKTIDDEELRERNSGLYSSTTTSVDINKDFSLLAKLGFAYNSEFLIYGLIGADWGKVKMSTYTSYTQTLGIVELAATAQHSNSTYETGLLLGFGMEYLITKCSTIGLEYNYIDYSTLDFPRSVSAIVFLDGVPEAGSSTSANNILKMKTNKVFIKFNFYFA